MDDIHVAVVGKAIFNTENPGEIVPEASQIQDPLLFGHKEGVKDAFTSEKHPEAIAEAKSGEGSFWILGTIIYRPRRSDPIIAVTCCDMQHRSSSGNYSVTFSFPCLHL